MISPARLLQTQIADALICTCDRGMLDRSAFNMSFDARDSATVIANMIANMRVKPCLPRYSGHDKHNYHCHYRSAIAFSLAHQQSRSPLAIAQILHKLISELINEPISHSVSDPVGDLFRVEVVGDGWLHFHLSDRLIADSLSTLLHLPDTCDRHTIDRHTIVSTSNFPGYSYVQYVYARCWALWRLARDRELVNDLQALTWQLLDANGNLYLRTVTEQRLALCLLAIADEIDRNSCNSQKLDRKMRIKLSKYLADNFLNFYDSCQILRADYEVSIARIGLVAITRKAVKYLVEGLISLPESF